MDSAPESKTASIPKPAKPLELVINDKKKSSINSTSVSIQVPKAGTSCPICLDEYPEGSIIKISLCRHFFCSQCLKEYLLTRINNSKVLMIPCPQSGCNRVLTKPVIKKNLDPEDYKKYRKIANKKLTLRDTKRKFCPKPGCSKQLRTSYRKDYTTCTCGTEICNSCNNFRHEGKSCLEAIDPEFTLYSRDARVRFCIVCKTPGRKESGCNHIKCPACDFDWCWACGREFSDLHICPYHWSPISPRHWKESSTVEKIRFVITKLLRFPLELLRFLLLWPLYEFFKPETDLTLKKPFQSFAIILASALLAILYSPYVLFYLIVTNIIIFICFVCKLCCKPSNNPSKRWMAGDADRFGISGFKLSTQEKPPQQSGSGGDGRQIASSQQPNTEHIIDLEKNGDGKNKLENQVNDKGSVSVEVFVYPTGRLSPKMDTIESHSVIQEENKIKIEIQG